METFGKLAFVLLVFVVGVTLDMVAIRLLWTWFIAGTFGVKTLTYIECIGLSLFISWLRPLRPKQDEEGGIKALANTMLAIVIKFAMLVGASWLLHLIAQ
jgi:hypothetical protein